MERRIFSALPGLLTVCLVTLAALYLVGHPPIRATTGRAPREASATPPARAPAAPAAGPGVPNTSGPAPAATPTPPAPPASSNPGQDARAPQLGPPESSPAASAPTPEVAPAPPVAAMPPTILPKPQPPAAPQAPPLGSPRFHVQAGAFSIRENADALVQQLRASHYPAVIVPRGTLYLVWVGPAVDRPAAERLMAALGADGFETTLSRAQ